MRLRKPKRLPFLMARVSRTDGQRAYVRSGAISGASVSVQPALAGRATCASASGAGNELPACPSALPGWGSIAQLCR